MLLHFYMLQSDIIVSLYLNISKIRRNVAAGVDTYSHTDEASRLYHCPGHHFSTSEIKLNSQ